MSSNSQGQSSVRGTPPRNIVQKDVSWRAFNALDADDEAQMLARRSRLMATTLGQHLTRERPSQDQIDSWEKDAMELSIDPSYTGPHLTFPLTASQIHAMSDAFRMGHTLHYKYSIQLAAAFRRWANTLPTLVEVTVNPGEKLTVCGDTHGQLADLCTIFALNGVPSPTNRYLWNGDYVDRGENGCEILFVLMAWCLLYAGTDAQGLKTWSCMLHRGNHETHAQNVTGGFLMEVMNKYSGIVAGPSKRTRMSINQDHLTDAGLRLYDTFQSAFDCMPLSTIITQGQLEESQIVTLKGAGAVPINPQTRTPVPPDLAKRVFVVHGGLLQLPGVTLSQIAAVQRRREIPYGLQNFEDKLFEDLMWSDPRVMSSTAASDRGAGVFFGSDVTEAFCKLNKVSLVIRSHECVPEGYLFTHEGRLITIFSASRYCGRGNNRGAFMTFESDLRYTICQYSAGIISASTPAAGPLPTGKGVPNFLAAQYDASTPYSLESLTPVGTAVSPALRTDEDSAQFPSDAVAQNVQAEAVRTMLMERIILRKSDLYFFYSSADRGPMGSKDGCVSKAIWADGMRTVMNLDLPWSSLCNMLAESEPDGRINYSKFLDRYRIAVRPGDLAWMESITEKVCAGLFNACHSLEASFKALDEDGSGSIEFHELERGLSRMNLGLSRPQIYEIMSSMDSDKDGRIQFDEFAGRFKLVFNRIADKKKTEKSGSTISTILSQGAADVSSSASTSSLLQDPWHQQALEKVGRGLFKGIFGTTAPAIFAAIDTNGDGLLSPEEFQSALSKLDLGFTKSEIENITKAVDSNSSGSINYLEFVSAFKIADISSPPLASQVSVWDTVSKPLVSNVTSTSYDTSASDTSIYNPAPNTSDQSASWQKSVIDKIVGILYEYRVELGAAFSMFDTDRSGKISAAEFRVGLQALTSLTGSPLTDMQADEVLRALDTNGDGEIDWQEFVGAFKLVDTASTRTSENDI